MDDLISRKKVLDVLNEVDSPDVHVVLPVSLMMWIVKKALEPIPSVPAVPLDKLCEWLERYASMKCYGCIEAFRSCEDEENQEVSVCNSQERWKAMLTKWMEEQHET